MKTDLTARIQGAGEMETGDDMTFQDIFKSSFLENADAISVLDMAMTMVLAFLVGLFIFFIYKRTYSGVMYSTSFGVTLIVLTLITALLIMAVTSNIILSLGMVGALSIVRFRTAINGSCGYSLSFLEHCRGHRAAAGLPAPGSVREPFHRTDTADIFIAERRRAAIHIDSHLCLP